MNRKISVIVPVYKAEQYLDRCVSSILNQTYRNLEIILVNDGSPDKCPQMCDIWRERDDRIKVIHKENGGLSSARNVGLANASGDYIAFVDSDDYIKKNMIETMLNAALKYDVSVVCCGRIRVTQNTEIEMFNAEQEKKISGEEAIRQLLIGGIVEEAAWDKLYERNIFSIRRFPMGEINEDIVQTIDILGSCGNIVHVGKALYYYCENKESITASKYTPEKKICLLHLDEIEIYLRTRYPHLLKYYPELEARYCQCLLYLLLDNEKTLEAFRNDYDEVFERFKKAFPKTKYGKKWNNSEKVKGILIYCRLYYWMRKIKKAYVRKPAENIKCT